MGLDGNTIVGAQPRVRDGLTEYEGRTLRENLGLPRPANQFSTDDTVYGIGS